MIRRRWIFHPVLASAGFVLPIALANVATAETPTDDGASASQAAAPAQPTDQNAKAEATGKMPETATPSTAGDSSQTATPSAADEGSEPSDVSAAPPPSAAKTEEYVVKPGDTLGDIAREHLGSAQAWPRIAELNGIHDPTKLSVGTRLELPAE